MDNRSRFRLTKGEFSNYLERNHGNTDCFGPLHGEERSAEKSLETKRSIMRESTLQLEKSRDKIAMYTWVKIGREACARRVQR